MTTHGGSRPGAGRPPAFKPTSTELRYVAELLIKKVGSGDRSDEEITALAQYFYGQARVLDLRAERLQRELALEQEREQIRQDVRRELKRQD